MTERERVQLRRQLPVPPAPGTSGNPGGQLSGRAKPESRVHWVRATFRLQRRTCLPPRRPGVRPRRPQELQSEGPGVSMVGGWGGLLLRAPKACTPLILTTVAPSVRAEEGQEQGPTASTAPRVRHLRPREVPGGGGSDPRSLGLPFCAAGSASPLRRVVVRRTEPGERVPSQAVFPSPAASLPAPQFTAQK